MRNNESQQINDSKQSEVVAKKQSHQMKALFYKTATLQWKQPCTNICQIITPIICLIFTGLIRNVAIDNLPTNQQNVFNQVPFVPFKFNDLWFQNQLKDEAFKFNCNRWLLYDWANDADAAFIGTRDGVHNSTGFLKHVLKTNSHPCAVNESFYFPYYLTQKEYTPYFESPRLSINQEIFNRYLYFNTMNLDDVRNTRPFGAIDKMPDGAVLFNQANINKIDFDLKVNDERSFELHGLNAITKIAVKDPLVQNATFQTYYLISQGFLNLLDMVTFSYVKHLSGREIVSGYIYMPITGNSSAFIQTLINIIATIIFPLSLSLLLPVFLYNLVLEKQTKIIQMMRMNGLSIVTYWTVNFMFNFMISILTYIVFFLFGYYYLQSTFFLNTSFALFCIILFGWIICQIGMSMIFQVFISDSRAANIIGYLVTIWTNLIGATLSVAMYQYPVEMPFLITLWPTIGFNRIFYLMFINCSADHCYDSLSALPQQMWRCIIIIYVMAIVFMLFGMYMFEIIPQEFGVSKNILFPLNFLRKKKKFGQMNLQLQEEINEQQLRNQCDSFAINQVKGVQSNKFQDFALICNKLTKVYDNGKKAMTDFNLILQDNQVFGLLGPNGAGKTTLISMITGIFSPTSGSAYVAGHSIQTEIDQVHMNMGVCPQFDILWTELTVSEHLYFYARLRGTPSKQEDSKVKQTLAEVALEDFANFKVHQLSGGMKRRLSVAISLVGDPRIVFLDEPTTGLDPQNRRNLWELLSKCKNKRSLFLTTHMMEEAESLCDRIGVVTDGRLRTLGNQMELKKKYGNGYSLTISIQLQREIQNQNVRLNQKYDEVESDSEYSSDLSEISRRPSRPSVSSISQFSPNYLMNESIQPTSNKKSYNNNILQQKLLFESNSQSRHALEIIKSRILTTFAQQQCRLIKQINGTLKFNLLNSNVKISRILQELHKMKSSVIQNKQTQVQMRLQDEEIKDFGIKNHTKSLENIQFDWSINNSSLEDVFLNVVQTFPKKQIQQGHAIMSLNELNDTIQV